MIPGLAPDRPSPLAETCVALDLETTGLSPDVDEVIEVGAVKFRGDEVLGTFQTLVNPFRPLPWFIQQLTGIADVDLRNAPPFAAIAGDLAAFVGESPLVGHNVGFDLAFLARRGVRFPNRQYDTLELAQVVLPRARDYGLARLARSLGCAHDRSHRALEDAETSRRVFLVLVRYAQRMDAGLLGALARLAARSPWPLRHLLARLPAAGAPSVVSPLGVDLDGLRRRLARPRLLSTREEHVSLDEGQVESLLADGGVLASRFPGYERRPEQVEMLRAVTRAFNSGHHIIVEGGTGIGKSLAYLLPAILFAVRNQRRVVVSTNTINLQEQLVLKDIPALVEAMRADPGVSAFQAALLKGRANYLCLRRWVRLASAESLAPEEAKAAARTLVWLQDTATGDRAELNLNARDAPVWERLSARGFAECPGAREGACFYRSARERAAAAHLVVVNHALLLSDLAVGGALLPPYDHLIVDEAHHLEEEATRQFGFQVAQGTAEELCDRAARLLADLRVALRAPAVAPPRRESLEQSAAAAEQGLRPVREHWGRLCAGLLAFMGEHQQEGVDRHAQLRVTHSLRAQPAWSDIEIVWSNFDAALGDCSHRLERLGPGLEGLEEALPDHQTLAMELSDWLSSAGEVRERAKVFIAHPSKDYVYWLGLEGSSGSAVLNGAPLHVGPLLREKLFDRKETVVLTSATLSTQGTFQHTRERLGFQEGEELLLGSPFDYRAAVLLLLPDDMPEPDAPSYQEALQRALADLARSAGGRTMALFTSHAALQAAHRGLRRLLEGNGIEVLGQGVDGAPRHLAEQFQSDSRAVLLGTASFWEGVDMEEGVLKVLAVARLPFNVPTEPVFAARAQLYEDPFGQYGVPQAVLRFRQGFGRLIRRRGDRGVVAVLDRRATSRSYGSAFLNSIPRCNVYRGPLRDMPSRVEEWLS